MRSRRSVLLLSGVLSVIVLVALGVICIAPSLAAAPVTDMNQIVGRDWVLTQMDENPAPDEPPVTLTFGIDGNLFGAGGCNQYYGSYKFNSGVTPMSSKLASQNASIVPTSRQYACLPVGSLNG